jgi:hypothetical protein
VKLHYGLLIEIVGVVEHRVRFIDVINVDPNSIASDAKPTHIIALLPAR